MLLFAKELVTELNARDSKIIREAVHEQHCASSFRVDHYEQVPVMRPNARQAEPILNGVSQSKKGGKGGPGTGKSCVMCGAAMKQGGAGGKHRGVGTHDCKFCRFCFGELSLKKGDPNIPLKASCKHCQICSVRGKHEKIVLKANCSCQSSAGIFSMGKV